MTLHAPIPFPLAAIPSLELDPALSLWFLLPGIALAVALILYLYKEQRRLASPRTIRTLTILRLTLVALLLILFLQPTVRWTHTHTSAGSLWLLVDQSPSMQATDPQATLAEHVHWAQALGYLPTNSSGAPDLLLARFTALAGEFATLHPDDPSAQSPEQIAAARAAFSQNLGNLADHLDTLRHDAAADPSSGTDLAKSALDALSRAASLARTIAKSSDPRPSTTEDWAGLQTNLEIAHSQLAQLAQTTDADFTSAHAQDTGVATNAARVANISRADLAQLLLTAAHKRGNQNITDLVGKYRFRIASFADGAQSQGAADPDGFPDALKSALAPAVGQSTNISAGLQAISEQIPPDDAASVIILSDGRQNEGGDPTEPARSLAARGVHIYGLLVGSHEVSADAAVEQIDAPEWIFKGDTIRAAAMVRLDGLAGKVAHVELTRAGKILDAQNVPITSNHQTQRVEFHNTPPDTESSFEYEIHVSEMPGEVNTQNNRSTFRVGVKKDKIYALLIDDRPRWDYRYLAASLSRDPRIKLQTVLLDPATIGGIREAEPAKASPSNPHIEAQILPQTRDEWQAFDIIILGDIGPDTLPTDQQQFIAAAVRDKGATLITIAGQRQMPANFLTDPQSPLSELLPVTSSPQFDAAAISNHMHYGFRPSLAPEGSTSVLGQFGLDADANADFWSNIPLWYWHSPFTAIKPSASVIWSIAEPQTTAAANTNTGPGTLAASRKNALLATMPVGLGHSLYLASDQTWRLRQVYGTNVHERFWGQVLRWAVGSDLPGGGKFVRFGASQPVYTQGQPVTITARILKEDVTPYTGLTFSALATPKTPGAPQNAVEAHFVESPESPGYYHATLGGLPPGTNEITLQGDEVQRLLDIDPTVSQKSIAIKILPQLDAESRNLNTDPDLLARIAAAGGGFSLDVNYADILADHLPEIRRTQSTAEQVGFFSDPNAPTTHQAHWLFLLLFTALLTTEWSLRKHAGLV